MLYAIDIHVGGSYEVFNINERQLDGILSDIDRYKDNYIVRKRRDKTSIIKENSEVLYFSNKSDRVKKIMRLENG